MVHGAGAAAAFEGVVDVIVVVGTAAPGVVASAGGGAVELTAGTNSVEVVVLDEEEAADVDQAIVVSEPLPGGVAVADGAGPEMIAEGDVAGAFSVESEKEVVVCCVVVAAVAVVVVVVVLGHTSATVAAECTVPFAWPATQSGGHSPVLDSYAKDGHGWPVHSFITPGPAQDPHEGAML